MKKISSARELKESYDAIYSSGMLKEPDPYYGWILELLGAKNGKKLLDVACGGGFLLKAAESRGLLTYGTDISVNAVKIARKNAPNSVIAVGDAEELPFKNNSFDYVTCLGSFEHFLNPDRGVRELTRVLKPNGKACVVLPNSYFMMDILRVCWQGRGPSHGQELERFATRADWVELLEKNGLDISRTYKYNKPLPCSSISTLFYKFIRPIIPTNLSYHFVFICKKAPARLRNLETR